MRDESVQKIQENRSCGGPEKRDVKPNKLALLQQKRSGGHRQSRSRESDVP